MILNKCDDCGKFYSWANLKPQVHMEMDINGNITQYDWLACIDCLGVVVFAGGTISSLSNQPTSIKITKIQGIYGGCGA